MASIKDVAEMAGVSLSTASIVANGKSKERKISEATQKKVLETMKALNYIPNVSAKTLRRGESQKYVVALFWNFAMVSSLSLQCRPDGVLFGTILPIGNASAQRHLPGQGDVDTVQLCRGPLDLIQQVQELGQFLIGQ